MSEHHRLNSRVLIAVAAAVIVHLLIGMVAVQRSGYSADEEITAIVVRGISDHGAPVLPSGVFYNRGLPFSYMAWAAGRVFGDELSTYRTVSLVMSAAGLLAVFAAALRMGGPAHGLVAVLVLATLPPYLAAASFARGYSALVACVIAGVAVFARWLPKGTPMTTMLFLAAAALANALHPLGIVLLVLPGLCAVLPGLITDPEVRAALRRLTVQTAVVTVASYMLYLLHWRSLIATGTTVTRDAAIYAIPTLPSLPAAAVTSIADAPTWALTAGIFALAAWPLGRKRATGDRWFLAACAVLGAACQVGMLIVILALTCLTTPRTARFRTMVAALFGGGAVFWWAVVIAWRTDALFSAAMLPAVWELSTAYPLSAARYSAESLPHVSALAAVAAALAAASVPTSGALLARVTAIVALLTLTGFSVLEIPLVERYLLLPWILLALLASYGIVRAGQLVSRSAASRSAPWMPTAFAAAICVVMVLGHLFYGFRRVEFSGPSPGVLSFIAPRTGASWSPSHVRTHIPPSDAVVCTEELACLYLVGRVDYALALTPVDLSHYAVRRHNELRGFYADSPVLGTLQDLTRAVRAAGRCVVVINLHSRKIDFDAHRQIARGLLEPLCGSVLVDTEELNITRFCPDPGSR